MMRGGDEYLAPGAQPHAISDAFATTLSFRLYSTASRGHAQEHTPGARRAAAHPAARLARHVPRSHDPAIRGERNPPHHRALPHIDEVSESGLLRASLIMSHAFGEGIWCPLN